MMLRLPLSRVVRSYVSDLVLVRNLRASGFVFSSHEVKIIRDEYSNWLRYFLPFDMSGKVVLDVGATEGGTAKFYLECGAKKVYCIECDVGYYRNLELNSRRFKGIVPFFKRFSAGDLFRFSDVDFVKIDIEGYEECLLDVVPSVPVVMEVHGLQLREKFLVRGWRLVKDCDNATCNTVMSWRC